MKVNENHVEALVKNYRSAWPNASDQQAWDWAAERYLESYERLAHGSAASVDRAYDLCYNVAKRY